MRGNGSRILRRICLAAALALALPAAAHAYDVAPGWTVESYAGGFPSWGGNNDVGPIGVTFDGAGNLFVASSKDGALYKLPPGGGPASSHLLRDGYGVPAGLAFDRDGRLYMARRRQHDVIEVDPGDGHYIRTVASDLTCALGLALDPVSGDLFVSTGFCEGGGIFRLSNFSGGPATVTRYAGSADADGLTFGLDGTLWAAAEDEILRIDGTNTATPGRASKLADVPHSDGIAIAPASGSEPAYLVVARTDGNITRVNFDGTTSDVVTNAPRGDLVTVGPDRCMYITWSNEVVKLGPASGPCFFEPDGREVLGVRLSSRLVTDLSVKASAPKRVSLGRRFTVKLRVRNNGPRSARSVVLTNTIPKGTSLVRVSRPKGVSCKRRSKRSRAVVCRKSSLAVRKSFTVRMLLRSRGRKTYTDTATVKSRNLDNVMGNNRSRARTRVVLPAP